ncbi:MAG: replication/maintenance protein RepL [Candidatus Omnitrophica bacterium]|nr:replication/maintenance protein RepL [Candidatus Omnitrophota bacterium]
MDLEKILNPQITFKIIKFFHENPQAIDTAESIALWTGINIDTTEKTLKKLVDENILGEHHGISTRGYAYTQDPRVLARVDDWLSHNHAPPRDDASRT